MAQQRKGGPSTQPDEGKASEGKVQGEGDYNAARRYDEKTRSYVQSNDVERAARDAEPQNPTERNELEQAEAKGKQRAKDEDPLLEHPEDIEDIEPEPKGGEKSKKRESPR